MSNILSENEIRNLSYTDFIALINQTNVPPGSHTTLSRWKVYASIDSNSNIFEVACTTGFSLLNLVQSSYCRGTGVDISYPSVLKAQENAQKMKINDKVKFYCQDATTFKSDQIYSHIILGAALGFFAEPETMIKKIISMVGETAYILASPFYAIKEIPKDVIDEARKILGITPTTQVYKDIMKLYNKFDIHYEDRIVSIPETEEELRHYCTSTINRACHDLQVVDNHIYDILYKRLYDIRVICNRIREYQNYSVLVLKYNKDYYPDRYVENF